MATEGRLAWWPPPLHSFFVLYIYMENNMVVTEDEPIVETIGKIGFTIRAGEHTPESQRRWDNRADTLAAWLLSEWRKEQQRQTAEMN